MSDSICLLITVLYNLELFKVALKLPGGILTNDEHFRLMDEDVRAKLFLLLPLHVQSCGPIVDVEDLFEIHEVNR